MLGAEFNRKPSLGPMLVEAEMKRNVTLIVVVAAGLSCGFGFAFPPHPNPANYNQDCAADTDCVLVFHKDCTPSDCSCGADGSIHRSDLEKFGEDESRSQCYEGLALTQCDCAETRMAVCRNGKCEIGN